VQGLCMRFKHPYSVENRFYNVTMKEQHSRMFIVNNGCSYDVTMVVTAYSSHSVCLKLFFVVSLVAERQK